MVYNTVSVRQVIAKVLTDNDIHEETHRVADFVEWAGEALEKIGAFPQLEIKVAGKEGIPLVKIENYQAQLPTGLHSIIQVVYTKENTSHGPYYPMRYGTGSFDSSKGITIVNDEGEVITEEENKWDTDRNIDLSYVVAGNWIKTNVKDGYLMIAYTQIPLDDDGYPEVPNKFSFIEALYWYITMKLLYPKWVNGEVRDAVYTEAKRSWSFYRKQAYAEALMPEGDQLTSIVNTWNKLVPELQADDTFFSAIGQKEIIYSQTNSHASNYTIF